MLLINQWWITGYDKLWKTIDSGRKKNSKNFNFTNLMLTIRSLCRRATIAVSFFWNSYLGHVVQAAWRLATGETSRIWSRVVEWWKFVFILSCPHWFWGPQAANRACVDPWVHIPRGPAWPIPLGVLLKFTFNALWQGLSNFHSGVPLNHRSTTK